MAARAAGKVMVWINVGSLWQSVFPGKFVLVSGCRERECSVSLQKDLPIDQECRF